MAIKLFAQGGLHPITLGERSDVSAIAGIRGDEPGSSPPSWLLRSVFHSDAMTTAAARGLPVRPLGCELREEKETGTLMAGAWRHPPVLTAAIT